VLPLDLAIRASVDLEMRLAGIEPAASCSSGMRCFQIAVNADSEYGRSMFRPTLAAFQRMLAFLSFFDCMR
jgi:hypothetical protein